MMLLNQPPPELLSDLLDRGITLAGGGSQLTGVNTFLEKKLKTPVKIAEDPISCVVRGTGKVLDDVELLQRVQVVGDDLI